jgi:hypothetical protein
LRQYAPKVTLRRFLLAIDGPQMMTMNREQVRESLATNMKSMRRTYCLSALPALVLAAALLPSVVAAQETPPADSPMARLGTAARVEVGPTIDGRRPYG